MCLLHHPFCLQLVFVSHFNFLWNFFWQRITDEGSIPDYRTNTHMQTMCCYASQETQKATFSTKVKVTRSSWYKVSFKIHLNLGFERHKTSGLSEMEFNWKIPLTLKLELFKVKIRNNGCKDCLHMKCERVIINSIPKKTISTFAFDLESRNVEGQGKQ